MPSEVVPTDGHDRGRFAAAAWRPWMDNESVAGEAFLSQDLYERELDRIFATSWSVVAADSDLPYPGSFVTSSLGGDEVVAVRQLNCNVTVLLNSCRHLGHKVVHGRGEVQSLRCGHRGWTYDLAGSLVDVPGQDATQPSFDFSAWSLVPVAEVVVDRGLILARWTADNSAPPTMPPPKFPRVTTTAKIAANWKCALETLLVLPGARWIAPNLVTLAERDTIVVVDPRGVSSTSVVVIASGELTAQTLAGDLRWTVRPAVRVDERADASGVVCANTGEVCNSAAGPDGCPLASAAASDGPASRRPVPSTAMSFYRWWLTAVSPEPLLA